MGKILRHLYVIENKLGIKFKSEPVYHKTYFKAKVREFDSKIKTNFLGNGVPKENIHHTCIVCNTIDSVMRIEKKKSSTSLFKRMYI